MLGVLALVSFPLMAQAPLVQQHPLLEHEIQDADNASGTWDQLPDRLFVSFGSTDERYLFDHVPAIDVKRSLAVAAWRGERVNAQLVLWSRNPVRDVQVESGVLRARNGSLLPRSVLQAHLVRYTLSDQRLGAIDFTCGSESADVFLVPDVLDRFDYFDLRARSVRPIWITVDIPFSATVGRYETLLKVRTGSGDSESLELRIDVQKGIVPRPQDWRFRLDLWQNPWAVAHYHDVEPWSEIHEAILRPHLQRLAAAGQKFVTTYVSHSPWTDDTYVVDKTMVEWVREADGRFRFNYEVFDHYVELAEECGLRDAITAYTMLPWQHRVRYLDRASGQYAWVQWKPDSGEFRSFWKGFLDDFRSHLLEKDWFGKTYIGINENPLEDTLLAIELLKEDSKDWKITYAGNRHEELFEVVDDYSVIIDQPIPEDVILERRRRGQTTTFYVCCRPPKPNNFTFSPPAESAWMGWHAFAHGYDGFLRWAFDNWTADPLRDTRHTKWAAGDCYLVYPDRRSSIRFERLREGFVDFEKLRILRKRLHLREDQLAREAQMRLENMLAQFTFERAQLEPVANSLRDARKLLSELTEILFEE